MTELSGLDTIRNSGLKTTPLSLLNNKKSHKTHQQKQFHEFNQLNLKQQQFQQHPPHVQHQQQFYQHQNASSRQFSRPPHPGYRSQHNLSTMNGPGNVRTSVSTNSLSSNMNYSTASFNSFDSSSVVSSIDDQTYQEEDTETAIDLQTLSLKDEILNLKNEKLNYEIEIIKLKQELKQSKQDNHRLRAELQENKEQNKQTINLLTPLSSPLMGDDDEFMSLLDPKSHAADTIDPGETAETTEITEAAETSDDENIERPTGVGEVVVSDITDIKNDYSAAISMLKKSNFELMQRNHRLNVKSNNDKKLISKLASLPINRRDIKQRNKFNKLHLVSEVSVEFETRDKYDTEAQDK